MADYPGASEHFVPRSFMFNSNAHSAIVLHKTAGDATPQAIYNTFMATGKSVHYGIGQDGEIWQYVPESLGAGGNCCVEAGHDPFWDPYVNQFVNLNLCTISIEHCDPSLDNSTPLTLAQEAASFKLVAYLVQKYNIPLTHIKGHFSIDPIDKSRCPGNYPWAALMNYLQKGGEDMSIDISVPTIADYFQEVDANHWLCKPTGKTLQYGMLNYYQTNGCVPYCGLSSAGLPTSDEIPVETFAGFEQFKGQGIVVQFFERQTWIYDPKHLVDNPPGSGPVYPTHDGQFPNPGGQQGGNLSQADKQIISDISAAVKLVSDTSTHILAQLDELK